MPKVERSSRVQETELTPISQRLTEKMVHAVFLSDHSRSREKDKEEESLIKKEYDKPLFRSRTLKLDLDETDILKSTLQIHQQSSNHRFKFLYYLLQMLLTYGFLIGINQLYRLSVTLPYILLIAIFSFFDALSPFKYEHLLIFLSYPLLIGNVFLHMQFLSYPTILICYLSVAVFQKKNQVRNLLVIWMFLVVFLYGWYVLPVVYASLKTYTYGFVFVYVYPVVDVGVELLLDVTLVVVNRPQLLYYQVYLFMLGLQFGMAMSVQLTTVEFWYLCVIYAIRVVNSRKQFLIGFLRRGLVKLAFLDIVVQRRTIHYKSGFLMKFSLHCVAIIYIYNYLSYNNYPYNTLTTYLLGLYPNIEFYQPLVIAGVLLFYELICLKMDPVKQQRRRILFEFRQQTILQTIKQSFINVFGVWIFYVGFMIPSQQVKYV